MPLTGFEFAVGIAILAVLVLGIVMLNKWRSRAGWWLLAAIVAYIIIVSFAESAANVVGIAALGVAGNGAPGRLVLATLIRLRFAATCEQGSNLPGNPPLNKNPA